MNSGATSASPRQRCAASPALHFWLASSIRSREPISLRTARQRARSSAASARPTLSLNAA